MALSPTEVVEGVVAALNARDVEGYLALCTDDVELVSPLAGIEGANVGKDGVREFFDRILESTEDFHLDIQALEAVGDDRVLATVELHVLSAGGIAMDRSMTNLYEVSGDKLRRVQAFTERDEALRAAGLDPA